MTTVEKPMSMTERIERAAKDHWAHVESLKRLTGSGTPIKWSEAPEDDRQKFRNLLGWHLRAAFPELFSSPPTGWLAPIEATDEMFEAWVKAGGAFPSTDPARTVFDSDWRWVRDAYLSRQVKP